MKEIRTEITIKAPREKVWKTFTNAESYAQWNPFIKSLTGNLKVAEQITVLLQPPGGNVMTFRPKVLVFEENKEFRWLGKLFFKGLFDGEHYFQFKDNQDGSTTFVHGEKFTGILVPLFAGILVKTEKGFQLMNEALKEQVEKSGV